jgi:hypothetical protein
MQDGPDRGGTIGGGPNPGKAGGPVRIAYAIAASKEHELSSGLPVPREPASLVERSQDGEARAASSERRAGCPERTSGDGARVASSHAGAGPHRLRDCGFLRLELSEGQVRIAYAIAAS